jgi:hypothetical protein
MVLRILTLVLRTNEPTAMLGLYLYNPKRAIKFNECIG